MRTQSNDAVASRYSFRRPRFNRARDALMIFTSSNLLTTSALGDQGIYEYVRKDRCLEAAAAESDCRIL